MVSNHILLEQSRRHSKHEGCAKCEKVFKPSTLIVRHNKSYYCLECGKDLYFIDEDDIIKARDKYEEVRLYNKATVKKLEIIKKTQEEKTRLKKEKTRLKKEKKKKKRRIKIVIMNKHRFAKIDKKRPKMYNCFHCGRVLELGYLIGVRKRKSDGLNEYCHLECGLFLNIITNNTIQEAITYYEKKGLKRI